MTEHHQSSTALQKQHSRIKILTYLMFFMFAMTSDAVGVIIPELIKNFGLTLTQASAFHYIPMISIALSGLLLGFLADKIGRKKTIIIGLMLFTTVSILFSLGNNFLYFISLLSLIGVAVGLFKTGALALIGDISSHNKEHTNTMNLVEGFFGLGAIIGPAIVSYLLTSGVSWKYLYIAAGIFCGILCIVALNTHYPKGKSHSTEQVNLRSTLGMMKNQYALGYSIVIALYVATEVAIYVWMPTFLLEYKGSFTTVATYALTIFFILRASGRFLGVWVLKHFTWQQVMLCFSFAIFSCYLGAIIFGVAAAVILLPLSGLFMSMIYPTLNSKGISCFDKTQHGAVAGVILFFTAVSAAVGPLLMGLVSDYFGDVKYGFYLAGVFSLMLFLALLYNYLIDPSKQMLLHRETATPSN